MSDPSLYLAVVVTIVSVLAAGLGLYSYWDAKRAGKKIDAIRKEKADLERQLRNLKPHLQ